MRRNTHGFHCMHCSPLSCHCDLYMWHPLHAYASERRRLLLRGFFRFLLLFFLSMPIFLSSLLLLRQYFLFFSISPKNMFRFIKRKRISCSSRLAYSSVLLFTVAIVTCSSINVGFFFYGRCAGAPLRVNHCEGAESLNFKTYCTSSNILWEIGPIVIMGQIRLTHDYNLPVFVFVFFFALVLFC